MTLRTDSEGSNWTNLPILCISTYLILCGSGLTLPFPDYGDLIVERKCTDEGGGLRESLTFYGGFRGGPLLTVTLTSIYN